MKYKTHAIFSRPSLVLAASLICLTATSQAATTLIGGGTGSGMTATASVTNPGGWVATNTINGSGLNTSTGVTSGDNSSSNMWVTPNGNDPTTQWIEWNLGDSYVLDSIHVWNAAFSAANTMSIKGVDIYFSNVAAPGDPEAGGAANWTKLGGSTATLTLPMATFGANSGFDLETATTTALPTTAVRWVRFELNSRYGSATGYTGISEIQFFAIPEPSSALLGAFGFLALLRRRR